MRSGLNFDHLAKLSTPLGLFEHALFDRPRREHGFCLDDVARGLVVTARQPDPSPEVLALSRSYLRFSVEALTPTGTFHNRRNALGKWSDQPNTKDHWGRGLWGLGTAAAHSGAADVRDEALKAATTALSARSSHVRSMAYASLGAAEVLAVQPGHAAAKELLTDARRVIGRPTGNPDWPWPEPRLRYANAVLPEALIAIGTALDDERALADGLSMLAWLVDSETNGDHLSVTPVGGWSLGEPRPGFDQQPIEVSALAEACWRAFGATGDRQWLFVIQMAVAWFDGANDLGLALYDPATGGGYDGLHSDSINQNQGAESTLAALATLQLGARAARAGRASLSTDSRPGI